MNRHLIASIISAIAPLILVVILVITNFDFVTEIIEANVIMNTTIFFITGIGAVLVLQSIYNLYAHTKDSHLVDNALGRISIPELVSDPTLQKKRMMIALKRMMIDVLSQRRASEAKYIGVITEDVDSNFDIVKFLTGFLIALGLLGTFIGLLDTLTGIGAMLNGLGGGSDGADNQFLGLINQLKKPLAGMGIAFSASMCGLIGSLVLGVMMLKTKHYYLSVRSELNGILTIAIKSMNDMIKPQGGGGAKTNNAGGETAQSVTTVAAASAPSGPAVASGPAVTQPQFVVGGSTAPFDTSFLSDFLNELIKNQLSTQDIFKRGQESNLTINGRIELLANNIQQLVGTIHTSVDESKRLNDLIGFGPRMKDINENILKETKALIDLETKSMDVARIANKKFDEMLENNQSAISLLSDSKKGQIEIFEQLQKVEGAQIGALRHLFDVKENTKNLAQVNTVLEAIKGAIDNQNSSTTRLLEEIRANQENLARENRMEMRQMIRELSANTISIPREA